MSNAAYCQACRRQAAVKYCEFTQGIGMLVLRSHRGVKGNLCRQCASKYFWELNSLTLLTGWWGIISFVSNIVYIISNVSYFIGSRSLAEPGQQAFPVQQPGGQNLQPPQAARQVQAPAQLRPGQPPPSAPHVLASYRNDIVLRLRGGQSPVQIAQFIAPRSGVTAQIAQDYAKAVAEGKA